MTLRPIYTRADGAKRPPLGHGGGWRVAQEITATTPTEFNSRLREDLMPGQDAVAIFSISPAHPEGLALEASGGLEQALVGVEPWALPIYLDTGADARPLGARVLTLTKERGVATNSLHGAVTADPLTVWAAGGALAMPVAEPLDALAQWTREAAEHAPDLSTIGIDGRYWAEAGGTAVDELSCALASAVEYLRELTLRGVGLDVSVPHLRVMFSAGPQFLVETAKFRAWRLLLARALAACGADAELAARVSVGAATARWNKSRLDPHVNLLRATTEAFAAVLGGVDSLHVGALDEVAGTLGGDPVARRVARNVHALLGEEFGATFPQDPAGGAWCIESLTDELARLAWARFQGFEKLGGFAAALRAGEPQRFVADAAEEKARAAGARRLGLVGTNLFPNLKETPLPAAPCSGGHDVGLGRDVIAKVNPFRAAAGFETLRDASGAFAARTGSRPKVFLARMGPVLQHKARADFASGFFAPGGFEVIGRQSFATALEAATAASASGADVAVLCSTDETYPELVPASTAALRAARPETTLVLAGSPAEAAQRDAFTAAGIDLYIHLRAPVEETLLKLLKKIGAVK